VTVASFRVEKQSYSRGAWRVLDADGAQVWRYVTFNHPHLGETVINGPVCFETKKEALAWIANQPETVRP
jgi:hypothetical protein